MTKLIGIIGGVSWESTAFYYQLINQAIQGKLGGLNSAKLLISSLNYSPIVELEREDNWAAVANILVETAKQLEQGGSELLILGCNTLHKVAASIENAVKIPFLHIADAVGEALIKAKIKKVGLLGTQFTMEDGFYKDRLQNKFKLEVITPPLPEREAIDKIIYQELCLGKVEKNSQTFFLESIKALGDAGAQGVILGCTEFGMLVKDGDAPVRTFDSMVLHVNKTVELSLS